MILASPPLAAATNAVADCTTRALGWQLAHNTGPALIVTGAAVVLAFELGSRWIAAKSKPPRAANYERRRGPKGWRAIPVPDWVGIGMMVFGIIITTITAVTPLIHTLR
jgi:hypothetical protein